MTELLQANAFRIPLDDKSCHVCITSPPYYSLRKYAGEQEFVFGGDKDCVHEFKQYERYHGAPVGKSKTRWQHTDGGSPKTHPEQYEVGQAGTKRVSISAYCSKCNAWRGAYGLEPQLSMYIDHTVEWCREVWRVLRDDGSMWINLGDSYNGSGGAGGDYNKGGLKEGQPRYPGHNDTELKAKDLMGVPWRVALALQADGWYLRSDIIWHKPNPMPESVTDRPTKSHEYLFLLTKRKKYYYDADAIREQGPGSNPMFAANDSKSKFKQENAQWASQDNGRLIIPTNPAGRNKRTVWTIATAPYSGAHFATFPTALVEPCIKAGTSEKGVCPECGNPWERVVEKNLIKHQNILNVNADAPRGKLGNQGDNRAGDGHVPGHYDVETLGWQPTCEHDLEPIPATVLDPFAGSGTTLLVARKLGRKGIGLDISADYLDLAKERLSIKGLHDWEHFEGIPGETSYEGLPMWDNTVQ